MKTRRQFLCELMESRRLLSAGELLTSLPDDNAIRVVETADYWFITKSGGGGNENHLAATHKQTQATQVLLQDRSLYGFELLNGKLYFYANNTSGIGLYESDGTAAGTKLVKMMPGIGSSPSATWALGGELYSYWYNGQNAPSLLYASDGTTAGTRQIGESPFVDAIPTPFTRDDNGTLWFRSGDTLWTADDANPVPTLFVDGFDSRFSVSVTQLISIGNRHYFTAEGRVPGSGETSQWLYTILDDGSGLEELNIPTASNYSTKPNIVSLAVAGTKLVFRAVGSVWALEGTSAAVEVFVPDNLAHQRQYSSFFSTSAGRVVFYFDKYSANDSTEGFYSTDGTTTGTIQLLQKRLSDYRFVTEHRVGNDSFILPGTGEDSIGWNVVQTDGTAGRTREIRFLANEAPKAVFVGAQGDRPLVISRKADGNGAGLWALNPAAGSGSFEGHVFTDWTREGLFNSFEPKVAGRLYLDINGDGEKSANELVVSTGDDGDFKFEHLSEGQYIVRFTPTYPLTAPAVHSPTGDSWQIVITPHGQVTAVNFIADHVGTFVWGSVFNDLNSNGTRDAGEAGANNQTVYLDLNRDGIYSSGEPQDTSDGDGYFYFQGAAAGIVHAGRRDLANFIQTAPLLRGTRQGLLSADGSVEVGHFGVRAQQSGAVSGVVWNDHNGNGVLDGDDTTLSGAAVFADLSRDGVRQFSEPLSITNLGWFTFPSMPSETTTFRLIMLSDYPSGTVITPESGITFEVPSGSTRSDLQFLVSRPGVATPPGKIGGIVFEDSNADGIRQEDEQGIEGRLVYLDVNENDQLDPSERRDSTDATGRYAFPNSAAGNYRVRVVLDAGTSYAVPREDVWVSNDMYDMDVGLTLSDAVAPTLIGFQYVPASRTARLDFDEQLTGIVTPSDLLVIDQQGAAVSGAVTHVTYDALNRRVTATFDFALSTLSVGVFTLRYMGNSLEDAAGNPVIPFDQQFGAVTGDVNGNGRVDFSDLLIVAQNYGQSDKTFGQGNVNYSMDGAVDFADLLLIAQHYGTVHTMTAAVTESKRRTTSPLLDNF